MFPTGTKWKVKVVMKTKRFNNLYRDGDKNYVMFGCSNLGNRSIATTTKQEESIYLFLVKDLKVIGLKHINAES